MTATNPGNDTRNNTCQIGVTPVQFFEVELLPVVPGMPMEPRYGRPDTYARYGIGPKPAATDQTKESQQ